MSNKVFIAKVRFFLNTPFTHPAGFLFASDQPVAEAATYKTHNRHNRRISMPSAGLEPAIAAIERPQTNRLTGSAYVPLKNIITVQIKKAEMG
jgi:hypothetical protein